LLQDKYWWIYVKRENLRKINDKIAVFAEVNRMSKIYNF
jgi:hypothetical protein